jgi:hypothetical protein
MLWSVELGAIGSGGPAAAERHVSTSPALICTIAV